MIIAITDPMRSIGRYTMDIFYRAILRFPYIFLLPSFVPLCPIPFAFIPFTRLSSHTLF